MSAAVAPAPAALAARRGFSPVTVLWLVLVGVFAMSALAVLSAYAPDLRKGDDGGAHALSKSAVGYGAAAELLRLRGVPVVVSRGALPKDESDGLLIITPTDNHDAKTVSAIRYGGPMLIVLPKWNAAPDPLHRGWVRVGGHHQADGLAKSLLKGFVPDSKIERRKGKSRVRLGEPGRLLGASTGQIDSLQTISGDGWEPVLVDETGRTVLAHQLRGRFYVLSDPDLLNTHGLHDLATARQGMAILDLLREGDGPVMFDATLHGFKRPRSLLRMGLEPPFLGVTLSMVALAALIVMQAFARFGPTRVTQRSLALGKQALADNTAGLIRMAKREHRMAAPYALLVRAAVARAIGAPRALDGAELDAFLDRLSKLGGATHGYTELAEEARAARTPADLMRVARKLHHWRLEMTRERR